MREDNAAMLRHILCERKRGKHRASLPIHLGRRLEGHDLSLSGENHEAYMRHSRYSLSTRILMTLALLGATITCNAGRAQQPAQPDNTAQNKQQNATADQQSNAASDREMTAKIRRSIIADKDLSMYAHNVKIIVRNGEVTLKGPVKTDDEKQKIQDLAAQVAGADKVTNDLSVKTQ
jgi:osmotically-inducible protein OsmY